MELIAIYLICCAVVGYVASQRGRSGANWFVISLLISPLIGIIAVGLSPSARSNNLSLEHQVRDSILEAKFAPYIRSHKPAFSAHFVHEVNLNGERKRFRSKADAIGYCMANAPQSEILPPRTINS